MAHISDIKLIRTDTTLDLSQKAEKGMLKNFKDCLFYSQVFGADSFSSPVWDLGNKELSANIHKNLDFLLLPSLQPLRLYIFSSFFHYPDSCKNNSLFSFISN